MTRFVPIVLISGLPVDELSARAAAAGAEGFCPKGLGPGSLGRVIDALLDEIVF